MCLFVSTGYAVEYTNVVGSIYADSYNISDNMFFENSATVLANDIYIISSAYIKNHGSINGNLHVNSGMELHFQNSGSFSGVITLNEGAVFIHEITDESEVIPLNVTSPHTINVVGANMLSLNSVLGLVGSNDKLILRDSTLILDCDLSALSELNLADSVFLYIPSGANYESVGELRINGNGRVYVYSDNSDILNGYQTSVDNGNLVVRTVRSTDYVQILHNKTGEFLNLIRTYNPDDKLLRALDNARSVDELNKIMSRSVRIHPRLMLNPIRTFNDMIMDEFASRSDMHNGAGRLMYVTSGDFDIYSANVNVGMHITSDFYISAFGALGVLDLSDDINEYGAVLYSGGIRTNYNISHTDIIRGVFGATYADIDSDFVFDGQIATDLSSASSIYGTLDFEHRFYFMDKFFVGPLIGAKSSYDTILQDPDFDSAFYAGVNMGYGYVEYGIGYGYGIRAFTETNGSINAEFKVSVWSPFDAIGGDLTIGAMRGDEYTAYKVSIGTHFMF